MTAQKSTNVRSYQAGGLALIRAGFQSLDLVAPELAARWAARIWCTPPRSRRGGRRDPAVPPGDRFMTPLAAAPGWASRPVWRPRRGRQFAIPVTGRGMVMAEVWGEGTTTTYLLHGWGGRRTQLASLVEPLVVAGQRVVALDAPGHGESGAGRLGGRRTTLAEFAAALTAVVKVTGPAHAIVAHSAGGGGAALAVQDGLPAGRLVFVAPMPDPMSYFPTFTHLLGVGPRTQPRLLRRFEGMIGRGLADLDTPARVAAWSGARATGGAGAEAPDLAAGTRPGQLPPLLVIHDRNDREVGYPNGQALAEAWPDARLLTTEGLGHRRILADPAVIDATVSFVSADLTVATAAGSIRDS
jgi:pimeloyl-ACP methyl ester carboxylesterase